MFLHGSTGRQSRGQLQELTTACLPFSINCQQVRHLLTGLSLITCWGFRALQREAGALSMVCAQLRPTALSLGSALWPLVRAIPAQLSLSLPYAEPLTLLPESWLLTDPPCRPGPSHPFCIQFDICFPI